MDLIDIIDGIINLTIAACVVFWLLPILLKVFGDK